jgi:hypothetical protein
MSSKPDRLGLGSFSNCFWTRRRCALKEVLSTLLPPPSPLPPLPPPPPPEGEGEERKEEETEEEEDVERGKDEKKRKF